MDENEPRKKLVVKKRQPLRQNSDKKDEVETISDERRDLILTIRYLVKDRDDARLSGNYAKADTMREKLESRFNIEIVDQKDGPSGWRFKDGSSNKLPPGTKIPEKFAELRKATAEKKKRSREEEGESKTNSNSESPQANKKQKVQANNAKKSSSPELERNRALVASVTGASTSSNKKNVQGVIIEEVQEGHGPAAKSGDRLQMHYVGRLKTNNKIFDSSKRPFAFRLGRGEVIKGWDIGCTGMKVGGKRTLTIPPEKGYGRSGAPPAIPPNATLVFDISLVSIK